MDLERQSLWNLYQMRGLIRRAHGAWIATDSKSGKHIPWATEYSGPEHVLFGHDSRKGLQVHVLAHYSARVCLRLLGNACPVSQQLVCCRCRRTSISPADKLLG